MPKTKTEYRIFIDDVNGHKVGNFAALNWSIREIGFEDDDPLFKGDDNLSKKYFVDIVNGKPSIIALEAYKEKVSRILDTAELQIKNLRDALERDPVLESEINPPEDKVPASVEAKVTRAFEHVNPFNPPKEPWVDTVNMTALVKEALSEETIARKYEELKKKFPSLFEKRT